MSSSFLFSSNTSPLTTKNHINPFTSFPHTSSQYITFNKRDFVFPISVNSQSISYPQPPSFNVEYLDREFGSHGVSFTELGDSYVIKMLLENGSAVTMLMSSGLITSYKPKMWFGSSIEVLHTSVSEELGVQGGVSLALDCVGENEFSWSPISWVLNDVNGNSQDSIQGKRNSVVVGRKGFEEVYIYSPGSRYESYSKHAYACLGQSAFHKPIKIGPEQLWRGEQHLHNPNL